MEQYNQLKFREFILNQKSELYQMEEIDDSEKTITLLAPKHTAFIKFFYNEIVELYIRRNGTRDNMYYLHFQANDEEYCTTQFNEMKKFFEDLVDEKVTRIMLTCSSGMTTSLFAMKLNEMAEIMKLDYKFDACNYKSIIERAMESSIVLVAPQIAHETEWIKSVIPGKIVINMPTNVFAAMKTVEMIDIIRDEIKKKEKEKKEDVSVTMEQVLQNDLKIAAVGIIKDYDAVYYPYRVYDHGKIVLNEEIIKTEFHENDIDGVLDYLVASHSDLDAICIASPGVTYHGFIGDINQDVEIIDIGLKYTYKYGVQVFVCNDVNAMALGYKTLHKNSENMLFYYHPLLSPFGGGGLIVNGKLVRGHLSVAGEMAAAQMMMEPDYNELRKTRDGATKMIVSAILSYIVTCGPEKVVVSSKMMPDPEKIKKEIATHINKLFVPDIRTTSNVRKYMLPGLVVYTLESLKKDYSKIVKEIKDIGLDKTSDTKSYFDDMTSGKLKTIINK